MNTILVRKCNKFSKSVVNSLLQSELLNNNCYQGMLLIYQEIKRSQTINNGKKGWRSQDSNAWEEILFSLESEDDDASPFIWYNLHKLYWEKVHMFLLK